MSSRVTLENKSDLNFKASTILFSEIESSMEKFWEPKISNLIIRSEENVVFGKLVHPCDFPKSANFILSVILSSEKVICERSQDTFIILKARLKNSKTGVKVYVYASGFPENISVTKPKWRKGTSKVKYNVI